MLVVTLAGLGVHNVVCSHIVGSPGVVSQLEDSFFDDVGDYEDILDVQKNVQSEETRGKENPLVKISQESEDMFEESSQSDTEDSEEAANTTLVNTVESQPVLSVPLSLILPAVYHLSR